MIFKRSLLSCGISASVMLASAPLWVQAQSQPALEEVVVTGIRASLNQAADIKRESYSIVDSVVAEDIGKLPDNNVVESLQRVSGIQVTDRGQGETSTVLIRGLSDVSTTVNGRTIYGTVDRAVELADIPSTLVSRIDVSKSRSADQYENGIAGTIDVRTFRPFDFEGARFSIAGRMIHQEEVDETDPVISALASNRWQTDAGDFGALINLSYSKTSYRDQTATSGAQLPYIKDGRDLPDDPSITDPETGEVIDQRYLPMQRIYPTRAGVSQNPIWQAGLDNGLPTDAGSTLDINDGSAEYVMSRDALILPDFTGERERPNANISLQFSPNENSEYYFEALYNGSHNRLHNLMYFAFVDGWESLNDISGNVEDTYELYPGTNVVRERTIRNTDVFTSGDFTETKSNSYVYALGGEWSLSENFDVRSELVYQESDYEREFFGMRANDQQWQATSNFDGVPGLSFVDDPETPDVDESNLTDPSLYTMGAIYDNADEESGSGLTFTADAEYWTQSDLFPKIEFGVRWDDRDASISRRDQDSEEMGCEARQPTEGYTPACDFSTYDGLQKINEGYLEGHANVPRGWMSADSSYISANRDLFRDLYNMELNPQFRKTFEADERNAALYAKVRFEADLMGRTLDGEVGGRYVDVLTETVFYDQQSGMASEGETTTSEFLPSAQLRYHLTDNWLLRFSYSEALRMPGFNDLNPTITYNSDLSNVGYGTASGGNENLKPTTSENLDLSLEWYFGDASYTYVTLFERKVEGLVIPFRSSIQADVEGVNTDTFILDRPENASSGVLRGAELGLTYFPENLPEALDGLGMVASATFLDSEQDIPVLDEQANQVGTRTEPFFGVSDSSYSMTLAYERPTFDVRLSYIWREEAINRNEAALFANPLRVWRQPETSLDMQFSYRVTDDFIVTFDATNLTGEMMQERYGNSRLHSHVSTLYSRNFALGARYTF